MRHRHSDPGRMSAALLLAASTLMACSGLHACDPEARIEAGQALPANEQPEIGSAAVEALTDQAALRAVALESSSPDLRMAALLRLTDQEALARVAMEGKDPGIRNLAVLRLTDQALLAKLAMGDAPENGPMRSSAAQRITDQAMLTELALRADDPDVGTYAATVLADRAALARVARTARHLESRSIAARRLGEVVALERLALVKPEYGTGQELMLPLATALADGLITAQVRGADIRSVILEITKVTPAKLGIIVEPGTYFVNRGGAQNMLSTGRDVLWLQEGIHGERPVEERVSAVCASMHREIPDRDSRFSIEASARGEELRKLAPLLGHEPYPVQQAAVWIVSDDASRKDLAKLNDGRRPVISDADVRRAVDVLQRAGVDLSRRAIRKWLDGKG